MEETTILKNIGCNRCMKNDPNNNYNYRLNWDYNKKKYICNKGHEEPIEKVLGCFDITRLTEFTEEILTDKETLIQLFLNRFENKISEEIKEEMKKLMTAEKL